MAASVQDFNVHTDVDASDCTRGLYGQRKALKAEFLLFFLIFFFNYCTRDSNPGQ